MTENINTNNTETAEKTFTQDDVNRIVAERLARDRDKRTAEFDEREKELKRRELSIIAREKLDEAGLSKELCKVLKYDDEAELDEAIEQLQHIKGFDGKKPEKTGKKIVEPFRLPEFEDAPAPDLFREAFKLPTDRS